MSLLRSGSKLVFATADRLIRSPNGPRILIYHQVGAGLGRQMEVTADDFVAQLDYLEENREVVDLDTALSKWDAADSMNLVVISFDDGYRDTYTTAFPELKRRGFPFTLYVSTGQVESGEGIPGAEPITWSQIAEMLDSGLVTLGAHTHNHSDLRTLSSTQIRNELVRSNDLIVSRTGVFPKHFAYPWGYWSQVAHQLVVDLYESAALGGIPNWARPFDQYRVPRYPVQLSDGFRWFPHRLRGGFLLEEWMRRRLRGYRGPGQPIPAACGRGGS